MDSPWCILLLWTNIKSVLWSQNLSGKREPLTPITSPLSTVNSISKMIAPDLSADPATAHHLLSSYWDILDQKDRPFGQTSLVTDPINTGDAIPIRRRPYRVSSARKTVIQKEDYKMMDMHIIEQSSSPWASQVVLVKKKKTTHGASASTTITSTG